MQLIPIILVIFARCVEESKSDETTTDASHYRIVGGKICESGYEMMVSIRTKRSGGHQCGGTMLSPFWILTAAHCQPAGNLVTIGVSPDEDPALSKVGMTNKIIEWILHPEYNSTAFKNDIAVARLKEGMNPTKYTWLKFKFITLPEAPIVGDLAEVCKDGALVMGWGDTSMQNIKKEHRRIRCVTLPVITQDQCQNHYKRYPGYVDNTTMCTYSKEDKDACHGDSGGPLICGDVQYGVVSWGIGCGLHPKVYIRTDKHLDFIWNTMTMQRMVGDCLRPCGPCLVAMLSLLMVKRLVSLTCACV